MTQIRILEVAELDFVVGTRQWAFPQTESLAIAAHWAKRLEEKPALYNGRVLLLGSRAFAPRNDGALRLSGAYFETDYANYLAWRDFGHPGEPVANCFSMAALQSADGAFLLGEMASHTASGGAIYFPAGTPDRNDVFDGRVDLDASARRELMEETGVSAESATVRPGWTVVDAGPRIACMKAMTLPTAAEEAKAQIDDFLALDPKAELSRMHIVRRTDDLDPERTPDFVAAYIRAAFAESGRAAR